MGPDGIALGARDEQDAGRGRIQKTGGEEKMRIGRILKSGDLLFSDSEKPASVSAGGVVLLRRGDDDYVRFRVPDTQCPPLPEPNAPLDDGRADVAEPGRWSVIGARSTANRWQLRASELGNDEIRLNYKVFPSDFHIRFSVTYNTGGGTYGYGNGHGVGVEVYVDDNNYIRVGFGRFWNGSLVGLWAGRIGGSDIFYEVAFIAAGSTAYVEMARSNNSVCYEPTYKGLKQVCNA
jgi:hypothetical protein